MKVGDLVKHEATGTVGIIVQTPQLNRDRAANMMSVLKLGAIKLQRWKRHLCEVISESR